MVKQTLWTKYIQHKAGLAVFSLCEMKYIFFCHTLSRFVIKRAVVTQVSSHYSELTQLLDQNLIHVRKARRPQRINIPISSNIKRHPDSLRLASESERVQVVTSDLPEIM